MHEDIELFKEYFYYDDGYIFWKKTSGTRGLKGSRAGKLRKDGYFDVGLKGKYYLVHRIIFALHYNYLPQMIDHVNRNRADNRIENLREADYSTNVWNSSISSYNSTGIKGIRKTSSGKFEARIAVRGKTIQVGTFDTIEEASSRLNEVREKEHGEYACKG